MTHCGYRLAFLGALLAAGAARAETIGEMPGTEDFVVLPDGRLVVSSDARRQLRGARLTSGLYLVDPDSGAIDRAYLPGRAYGFDALACPLRLQGLALSPDGAKLYAINKTGARCNDAGGNDGGGKHDRIEIYAVGTSSVLRYEGSLPVWEGRDESGSGLPHSLNDLVVDAAGRVHASANPGNLRMMLGYRKGRTSGRVVTYDPASEAWTARTAPLAQPNGVLVDGDRLLVTTTAPERTGALLAFPLDAIDVAPETVAALPGIPDNLTRDEDCRVWATAIYDFGGFAGHLMNEEKRAYTDVIVIPDLSAPEALVVVAGEDSPADAVSVAAWHRGAVWVGQIFNSGLVRLEAEAPPASGCAD